MIYQYIILFLLKIIFMTIKKTTVKRGRKPKKESDKVRVRPVYITPLEEIRILKKHETLTKALKSSVIWV